MRESNWDFYWGEQKKLEHWQKPSEAVIEFVNDINCNKQFEVLDIGCGIGRHAILFAQKGCKVTALDSSEQTLEKLENNIKKLDIEIEVVKGNYLESIFNPNSFNIIISYNVIYHGFRKDFERAIELCRFILAGNCEKVTKEYLK